MKSETRVVIKGFGDRERVYKGLEHNRVRGYRLEEIDFAVVSVRSGEEMDQIIDYLMEVRNSFGKPSNLLPLSQNIIENL